MKCVDVENLLDDFLNEKLDSAIQQKVKFHLKECSFCKNEMEKLQITNHLLKIIPPITPSNQFDERMMQFFSTHQQTKTKPSFWTAVLANFSISKPALALSLLAFAIGSILAFQLGRATSPQTEFAENQNLNQTKSSQLTPPVTIVEKRIEVPVIKTVEVPVYKEKIVNRVVYKNRTIFKTSPNLNKTYVPFTNFNAKNQKTTPVQINYAHLVPVDLKGFQPVSNIKVSIIKRGEKHEN